MYKMLSHPDEFNSNENVKTFLSGHTYYTPRVLRRERADSWECVTNKLYSHYQKHKDKEQGIEELTNEIMEFIQEIATKTEDDPDSYNERQYI